MTYKEILGEKLWAKTTVSASPTHCKKLGSCWEWTGYRHANGYGAMHVDGKSMYVHRLSWWLSSGRHPSLSFVLHRCDNPACVRPAHLFLGTHADNNKDRDSKKRQAHGETQGSAKLTDADVNDIRRWLEIRRRLYPTVLRHKGALSNAAKAAQYGIGLSQFGRIANGEDWKHVNRRIDRMMHALLVGAAAFPLINQDWKQAFIIVLLFLCCIA